VESFEEQLRLFIEKIECEFALAKRKHKPEKYVAKYLSSAIKARPGGVGFPER
jgi:hypothetical protein